jgi:hypothetical protein
MVWPTEGPPPVQASFGTRAYPLLDNPQGAEYSSVSYSQRFRRAETTATVRRLCPLFAEIRHLLWSRISLFLATGDERDAEILAHQNETFPASAQPGAEMV